MLMYPPLWLVFEIKGQMFCAYVKKPNPNTMQCAAFALSSIQGIAKDRWGLSQAREMTNEEVEEYRQILRRSNITIEEDDEESG